MQPLKKVLLLGKKPGAARALRYLLAQGIEVPFVVATDEPFAETLKATAQQAGVEVLTSAQLYERIDASHPRYKVSTL
jgi:hypothetical protein